MLLVSAAALICCNAANLRFGAPSAGHFRPFLDEANRTHTFHGVNVVYKAYPWHPQLEGFNPFMSLSEADAKTLQSWGMNVIRLGVMWPGAGA